jgi:hypothetical protein
MHWLGVFELITCIEFYKFTSISDLPRFSHVHDRRLPVSETATQVPKIGSKPPWYSTTPSVDPSPPHTNGQDHQTRYKTGRAGERVHPRADASPTTTSVDVGGLLNQGRTTVQGDVRIPLSRITETHPFLAGGVCPRHSHRVCVTLYSLESCLLLTSHTSSIYQSFNSVTGATGSGKSTVRLFQLCSAFPESSPSFYPWALHNWNSS